MPLRLLLASLIALALPPVVLADSADWTRIGGSSHFTLSINLPSIEHGQVGKAWLMYDFFEPTQNAYGHFTFRSIKALQYYRCADATMASKSDVFYSRTLGGGDVVKAITHGDNEMKFEPVVPGSSAADVQTLVCANKAPAKP